MNRLNTEKRCQIISALVEGCSLRSTSRMTGASKNTIVKLLAEVGQVCSEYQNEVLKDLPCKRLQCDEIWSFCYAKAKNVPKEMKGQPGVGDVWTWTAICADTKLVPSWQVGDRGAETAYVFIHDLAKRLANRVQLTQVRQFSAGEPGFCEVRGLGSSLHFVSTAELPGKGQAESL